MRKRKIISNRDALIINLERNLDDSSRANRRTSQYRSQLFNPYSLSDRRKYQATRKQRIDK